MTTQVRNSVSFTPASATVIRADRFVRIDPTSENGIVENDANQYAHGVSEDATVAGQTAPISVNMLSGSGVLEVQCGTGGVTAGEEITSDADGKAVEATTGQNVIGIAITTAAADAICEFVPSLGGQTHA